MDYFSSPYGQSTNSSFSFSSPEGQNQITSSPPALTFGSPVSNAHESTQNFSTSPNSKKRRSFRNQEEPEPLNIVEHNFSIKRQRTSMETSNVSVTSSEKQNLKNTIQNQFEEMGLLQVEIGIKKGEIFRIKQQAVTAIQGCSDPNQRMEIEQQMNQYLFPIESDLNKYQSRFEQCTREMSGTKSRMQDIEQEEKSLMWNHLFSVETRTPHTPLLSPILAPTPAMISTPNNLPNFTPSFSSPSFGSSPSTLTPEPLSFSPDSKSFANSGMDSTSTSGASNNTPTHQIPLAQPPVWHRDEDYHECEICNIQFSFFFRRHHCRKCGRVVCDGCSKARVCIPQFGFHEPVRVCRECEAILTDYENIMKKQDNLTFTFGIDNNTPGNKRLFSDSYIQQRKKEKQKRKTGWFS